MSTIHQKLIWRRREILTSEAIERRKTEKAPDDAPMDQKIREI